MTSLFASLGIAREAIQAQQFALDVTQNNIANVNTPGYSRQRATLIPGEPWLMTEYQAGAGVRVGSIESFRSRFLDQRVNDELQRQGEFTASSSALQQVEMILNENNGSGLQASLSAFFNSFATLANAPEDASLRMQVLARGQDMCDQFRNCYEQLQSVQTMMDRDLAETVEQINSLTEGIARLNVQVGSAQGTGGNESALRDQRQELLDKLGSLTDLSYFETESDGITVMTREGALLVVGNHAASWETVSSNSGGFLEVHVDGVDVTEKIGSGKLGALLDVRDNRIAGYLQTLDDMASGIMSRVNEQHALGTDFNGDVGGDFFVPFVPLTAGSNQGAARTMQLAITDPAALAAGAAGAGVGSNANARLLAGIQNERIFAGNTEDVSQFYSDLIFRIGLDTRSAVDGLETQSNLLTQLQNQRDALAGVSLDDEAVNLMRYQKAFEANARFISLIDTLTGELIRLLGE